MDTLLEAWYGHNGVSIVVVGMDRHMDDRVLEVRWHDGT